MVYGPDFMVRLVLQVCIPEGPNNARALDTGGVGDPKRAQVLSLGRFGPYQGGSWTFWEAYRLNVLSWRVSGLARGRQCACCCGLSGSLFASTIRMDTSNLGRTVSLRFLVAGSMPLGSLEVETSKKTPREGTLSLGPSAQPDGSHMRSRGPGGPSKDDGFYKL